MTLNYFLNPFNGKMAPQKEGLVPVHVFRIRAKTMPQIKRKRQGGSKSGTWCTGIWLKSKSIYEFCIDTEPKYFSQKIKEITSEGRIFIF